MTAMPTSSDDLTRETDDENVDPQQDPKSEDKPDLKGFDANELLLNIVSDPDVSRVLQAKRDKKPVRFAEDEEPKSEPVDDIKIETGDEEFDQNIQKIMGLIDKKFEQTLAPIKETVDNLQSLADQYTSRVVEEQIDEVAKKHSDLGTYRKAMAELAGNTSGLNVEELLLITKNRAGKLILDNPSTDSERPSPTPRRLVSQDRKEPARRGRKGFSQIVAEALDKKYG